MILSTVSSLRSAVANSLKIVGLACVAFFGTAFSKSAEEYFHGASYRYVEGKIQDASLEAEEGLRLHPHDAPLRALSEHLKKMKDEQRGEQGKGEGENKDKSKQDQKDQNENDDRDQNRDGKNGDQQGDDPKDPKNGNDKSDQDKPQSPEDREGRAPQGEAKPPAMSEEEAERLLNSFADDEKKEQSERRQGIRTRPGMEQDW